MWRVLKPLSTKRQDNAIRISGQLILRKNASGPQQPLSKVPQKAPEMAVEKVDLPKKGGGFFRLFSFVLLSTSTSVGGVVAYCWYDKNFREYIEKNVPYSAELLSSVFANYLPPPPYERKDKEVSVREVLPKQDKKPVAEKKDVVVKQESTEKAPVPAPLPSPPPPAAPSPAELKKQKQEQAQAALREKEKEEAAQNAALEVILNNNLQSVKRILESALESKQKAVQAAQTHMQRLRQAMDAPEKEANTDGLWSDVTQAAEWRVAAVTAARQASDATKEELEKLRAAVKDGRSNAVTKRNKMLNAAEEQLNKLNASLSKALSELTKAESDSNMVSEYRDLIRRGRDQFRKEVESIVPDVKLGSGKGGKMTEDDLNALIAHAHRRIEQLQRQLAEQLTMERQRVDTALGRQRQEDDRLTELRLEEERRLFTDQLAVEKSKWEAEAHVEFESELRRELSRQAAAHSDHLASVLRVQEQELDRRYAADLRFQLSRQNDAFHASIAQWVARMRGIEAAVDGRAELEKQGLRAQELWVASQAFVAAIANGTGNAKIPRKALASEAGAVVKASNGHPFVGLVVNSIPSEAVNRGVYTEEALANRFSHVRRICRRVAMIDETGGTLARYFLSYLQSLVVFSRTRTAAALAEGNDAVLVDADSLTTFDIVDGAQSALRAGRLDVAVRLVNQLQGEPRRVAADWLADARLLLEAQQASRALLAFAAASGAGAIY